MANRNIPRKSASSHLFLEASMRESHQAIQEHSQPLVSSAFELNESHIMSRRPTRLSLELLARAKERYLLPEDEGLALEEGNG